MRIIKLFVVSALVSILISGCGQEKLSEQEYLDNAKGAMDRGDYRESIIHLKNVLNHYPNSMEGRFLLGDIYVRAGVGGGAEKELQRARELGVAEEAIVEKLGDALLMQGKADELIKTFQVKDSDSPVVRAYKMAVLGDAYFQKRKLDQARKSYEEVLNTSKASIRAELGLARVLLLSNQRDKAIQVVDETIAKNKDHVLSWLTKADVYKVSGNTAEVISAYEKAAELSKSPQDYYYYVAMKGQVEQYLQGNNTEKAETVINRLKASFYKEQFPSTVELNHLRSVLAFQKKDYEVARTLAEKVQKAAPNHYGSLLVLGAVHAVRGEYEQAENSLQRFLSVAPNHLPARKLLAFVQLNRNEAKSAVATLKPLEKAAKPDAETLALIASASLRAGDAETGVEFFEKAVAIKPESVQLRSGLARGLVGLGEYDRAIAELNKVRDDNPKEISANLAVVETYIQAKTYDKALRELDKLEKSYPDRALYVSLQGTVHMLQGDLKKAEADLRRALEIEPGFPAAGRSLALIEAGKGNEGDPEKIYKDIIKRNPKHVETLYDYAQYKMSKREFEDAKKLIRNAQELDRSKQKGTVLLARVYLQEKKPSQALSELRAVSAENSNNPAILAEFGNAQMMLGEYVNALSSYNKLAKIEDRSAIAHFLVFTAYAALGQKDKAKVSLERSLELDAKFEDALLASFGIALSDKRFDEARKRIKELESVVKDTDTITMLNADLAMHERQSEKAIALYKTLYEKKATPDIVRKLAQAYWAAGKKEEALKALDDASAKYPDNLEIQYALATAYDGIGEKQKAIDAYTKVVGANDQHVPALNNLAWLLKDADSQKAFFYAEKALKIAPDNKDIQDTIAKIKPGL